MTLIVQKNQEALIAALKKHVLQSEHKDSEERSIPIFLAHVPVHHTIINYYHPTRATTSTVEIYFS